MISILVTGPIGGGKSTVCNYLAQKGFPVYDCDSRCKLLYDSVPGLKERIESELGLPFAELGRIFGNPQLRARLERIVYPLLVGDLKAWMAGLDVPVAFVESAIALDKPAFDGLYDKVLLVTAYKSLRFRRNSKAPERDGLQSFDPSRADFVIKNNASLQTLYDNVDIFINSIV